jgi:hypothetical protein
MKAFVNLFVVFAVARLGSAQVGNYQQMFLLILFLFVQISTVVAKTNSTILMVSSQNQYVEEISLLLKGEQFRLHLLGILKITQQMPIVFGKFM